MYSLTAWNLLRSLGTLVTIFPHFGNLCHEKSGSPEQWAAFCTHCLASVSEQNATFDLQQGDQIGLIFAYWTII
jgi:hypothetical protein